jgi:3-phenylpropionate/trans-cinnamate dioxygenase ferredoxin reductase subunit
MSRVTSEPVSRFFEQLHEQNGVRFVFGAAVTAVEGTDRAERIVTADGAVYPADVVLAGIGVVPNQELAETAGLECQDGILVDGDGKTSDPHIYAAGDATRFTSNIDGASQRLECIQNAMAQAGRVAADKFSVVYVRDGRLAAVDTVAGLTDFRPAKKLIAQRARIDPFLAADSGTPLTDAVFAAS